MFKKPIPTFFVVLIICIALLNGLAIFFSLYWRLFWLDMFVHFLGGLWVGGMYLWWYIHHRHTFDQLKTSRLILYTLLFVLSVGLLWEGFEYIANIVDPPVWYDMGDAASDLVFDMLGGSIAVYYGVTRVIQSTGPRV